MTRDVLLRKWVEALESGKYQQARNTLRIDDSYCCLGVACEISGMGEWRPIAGLTEYDEWNDRERAYDAESNLSTHVYVAARDQEEVQLPAAVRVRLGLSAYLQSELQTRNDDGESFAQIAQRIREWFPDVFAVAA